MPQPIVSATWRSIHERQPDGRRDRLCAAGCVDLDQGKRRAVRRHQPADRRRDTRQDPAGRPPPAAALFAGNAQRRESDDPAGGVARGRARRRRIRRLADPHQRGRPVLQRLCRRQPQFEDPRACRPQRRDAGARVRIRRDPALSRGEVRHVPAARPRPARGMPVLAVLADGERALPRRRVRAFLRLCAR